MVGKSSDRRFANATGTKISTDRESKLKRLPNTSVKTKKEAQLHANSVVSFCSPAGCRGAAAVDKV